MISLPWVSTVAAMPNRAPGVPLVSSCSGAPTNPSAGEISNSRFGFGGLLMSPLPTTRSPSDSSAALIGGLNWPPEAITRAEDADGPVKVSAGVGVVAPQLPLTTTPSAAMADTAAKATTL